MANNKVLIPLNQSELSREILPHIEKYFSSEKNDLILFYVTKPPKGAEFGNPQAGAGHILKPGVEPSGPMPHPIFASQQEDSIKAHVKAELMPITNHLEDLGYSVSTLIDFAKDPVDEILHIIEKDKIDLVAMSGRGRVGVTRFFFRDIADTIASKVKIPVLLILPLD